MNAENMNHSRVTGAIVMCLLFCEKLQRIDLESEFAAMIGLIATRTRAVGNE